MSNRDFPQSSYEYLIDFSPNQDSTQGHFIVGGQEHIKTYV